MHAEEVGPRIETERLLLRPVGMRDAWRITDLINDIDIARMTTSIPHPYSLADAEGFLARHGSGGDQDRLFAVEHRQLGMIGVIGFHVTAEPYPEVGYWLGRTFWRRGFATEALQAALEWARVAWGKRAIASGHFADNPASGRVLVKAGFLYTGVVAQRRSVARAEAVETRMMVWLA